MKRFFVTIRVEGFLRNVALREDVKMTLMNKEERECIVYVDAEDEASAVNDWFVLQCRDRLIEGMGKCVVKRQATLLEAK